MSYYLSPKPCCFYQAEQTRNGRGWRGNGGRSALLLRSAGPVGADTPARRGRPHPLLDHTGRYSVNHSQFILDSTLLKCCTVFSVLCSNLPCWQYRWDGTGLPFSFRGTAEGDIDREWNLHPVLMLTGTVYCSGQGQYQYQAVNKTHFYLV